MPFPSLCRTFACAALAVLLAGCAAQGSFPSLAPRAVERIDEEAPVTVQPNVPANAELTARVAELLAEARRGEAAFEAALPATVRAVSASGAAGSEPWIEAQQALSRLEAARGPTEEALAQLDRLRSERARQPTDEADFASLLAAIETVESLAQGQRARLETLRARLSAI